MLVPYSKILSSTHLPTISLDLLHRLVYVLHYDAKMSKALSRHIRVMASFENGWELEPSTHFHKTMGLLLMQKYV